MNEILNWLNLYIGTEWATYLGLGISIILPIAGLIFHTIFKKTKNKQIKQTQKIKSGNGYQTTKNINISHAEK